MTVTSASHIPVLLSEVVAALAPRDGGIYVDGTFGAGGYSRALLAGADCQVIALDRDPSAVALGQRLAAESNGRLRMIEGCFGDMDRLLADAGIGAVDGVALDIGVSSMQIDQAERGFSFAKDGPLDMRMTPSGPTAADVVNHTDEAALADILFRFGEERQSRRIARAIVNDRRETPFTRTAQLADLIRRVVRSSRDGIDPATRSFQALRIYVNDELGELERGLKAAESVLSDGGCLAVVTFHSLEDRMVKQFFKERSGMQAAPSRHQPQAAVGVNPVFALLNRKAVVAGEAEIRVNPRSRSAKLRAGRKLAPASVSLNRGVS